MKLLCSSALIAGLALLTLPAQAQVYLGVGPGYDGPACGYYGPCPPSYYDYGYYGPSYYPGYYYGPNFSYGPTFDFDWGGDRGYHWGGDRGGFRGGFRNRESRGSGGRARGSHRH
ncbi:MAG: hypothetical protein ACREFW_06680 [Rhizomicrobium sp.]